MFTRLQLAVQGSKASKPQLKFVRYPSIGGPDVAAGFPSPPSDICFAVWLDSLLLGQRADLIIHCKVTQRRHLTLFESFKAG